MRTKLHIVTGGCGFVGRNMVKYLLAKTVDYILIVDDLSIGQNPITWLEETPQTKTQFSFYEDRVIFIQEDIRNILRSYSSVHLNIEAFLKAKVQIVDVYHFAAVVGGRMKIEEEPLAVAIDLSIDAEFFNWVVKYKPKRVLYPSSSAAYPVSLQTELNHRALKEDDINFDVIKNPDLTYGWAKLTGEYLARLTAQKHKIHVACIRPFSGFGADQEASYPITAIARRFVNKESPIDVWGSGLQSRDFVYIDDVIECTLKALDFVSNGDAINIGSGKQTSFLEIINVFSKISGHQAEVRRLVDKPVGVMHRYSNVQKAKELLNWTSSISLEDGLRLVFEKHLKA